MSRLVLLAALLAPFTLSSAGEALVLGDGVGAAEAVSISDLLAHPDDYVGKRVHVVGQVTDVCPKRGCWMELAGEGQARTLRVKVEDGVIVFPMSAKGKPAEAAGVFTRIEMTEEQAVARAKHLAEERGETFDPEKAGEIETVIYQIQGTGAVIR